MNTKEALGSFRRIYEAIAPIGGTAVIGYWAGEAGMHAGAVGGFIGSVIGGELLKEVVRLKEEMRWDLKRSSRVSSTGMELTDASRRRIL